jgi:small subunit ribosomal protein S8
MYISDTIGDLLARIRNAQLREKDTVIVPASKMLVAIAEILKTEGFISDFVLVEKEPQKDLEITLKYMEDGRPAINGSKRMSKPGVRKYIGYKDIPNIRQGMGIAILSTPKGLMTGVKAKAAKVGGEFICTVY